MNEKDIRFIDSNYNELFRIKDGESITVTFPDGHTENRACRYIDDYHTYIGGNCFHICEWAERMEESKKTYAPAGKELFTLKNTTKDEFEFMFAPKDKETTGATPSILLGLMKQRSLKRLSSNRSLTML